MARLIPFVLTPCLCLLALTSSAGAQALSASVPRAPSPIRVDDQINWVWELYLVNETGGPVELDAVQVTYQDGAKRMRLDQAGFWAATDS